MRTLPSKIDKDLLSSAHLGLEASLSEELAAGASTSAVNSQGRSALMLAAASHRRECLLMLIAAGSNVDARDDKGRTAAMLASTRIDVACLEILIDAGADLLAKDDRGYTAGYIAETCGCESAVRLIEGAILSRAEALKIDAEALPGLPLHRPPPRL